MYIVNGEIDFVKKKNTQVFFTMMTSHHAKIGGIYLFAQYITEMKGSFYLVDQPYI